jgi:hypothetical protein
MIWKTNCAIRTWKGGNSSFRHLLLGRISGTGNHSWKIPKGFRLKAQGCEERATLGNDSEGIDNPNGVVATYVAHPVHNPVGVGNVRATRFPG